MPQLSPHILQVQQAVVHVAALLRLFAWVQVVDVSSALSFSVVTDEANRLRDWAEDEQPALQVGAQLVLGRLGWLEYACRPGTAVLLVSNSSRWRGALVCLAVQDQGPS